MKMQIESPSGLVYEASPKLEKLHETLVMSLMGSEYVPTLQDTYQMLFILEARRSGFTPIVSVKEAQ
jgi:hypothetical protein